MQERLELLQLKNDTEAVNNLNKFIEVLQAIMDMPKA